MLAQDHATGTEESCNDQHQAKPSHGVEGENLAEGKQSASHSSYGCGMGRDLPPGVDDGTDHLYEQRCHHNATHEMRDMECVHQIGTEKITPYGDDVGNGAAFSSTEFYEAPSLEMTVEADDEDRHHHCKEIDEQEDLNLEQPGQQVEVAEEKQRHQSYGRQIERSEDNTQQPGSQYQTFLS